MLQPVSVLSFMRLCQSFHKPHRSVNSLRVDALGVQIKVRQPREARFHLARDVIAPQALATCPVMGETGNVFLCGGVQVAYHLHMVNVSVTNNSMKEHGTL